MALAQERRPPPTLSLSLMSQGRVQTTPPNPTPNTPLCFWCRTRIFLPGHCGQCGVLASRFLNQKEAAEVCPAEGPQSSPSDCEQRGSENCIGSVRLPSLPDDEVFLEEAPLVRARSPADSQTPLGLPTW